jgi:hypothetical protein
MKADVAGVAAVLVAVNKVDTLAVWSAARTGGAGRRTWKLLAARGEENKS